MKDIVKTYVEDPDPERRPLPLLPPPPVSEVTAQELGTPAPFPYVYLAMCESSGAATGLDTPPLVDR